MTEKTGNVAFRNRVEFLGDVPAVGSPVSEIWMKAAHVLLHEAANAISDAEKRADKAEERMREGWVTVCETPLLETQRELVKATEYAVNIRALADRIATNALIVCNALRRGGPSGMDADNLRFACEQYRAALAKKSAGSDGGEVRSPAVGGAQLTQAGGDSGGMPLSVGRSRPDQTATNSCHEIFPNDAAKLAALIDLCDQLFHTVSFQDPLSKGQHITEQMRVIVYECGKQTPIDARKLLQGYSQGVITPTADDDGCYAIALHSDGTSTDMNRPYCRDCGSNDIEQPQNAPLTGLPHQEEK